jgi:alcohol dehydrogenase (cytochrome c)
VVDARNGKLLYQFKSPSGYVGQPVTYQGKDGRQYIAMLSGVGGWAGMIADSAVDPRLRGGALGFAGAMNDLPGVTSSGGTLMVFALPASAAH